MTAARHPDPAAASQAMLPLALHEHVELIRSGAAVTAFAERRAEQMLRFGHSPDADLGRTIDYLVREAMSRLHAFVDITGKGRLMAPPPARRDMLIRKVEIAGALLFAAYDRLHAEIADADETFTNQPTGEHHG